MHLALEKLLKAHVGKTTEDIPPKIHALVRLGQMAGLPLPVHMKDILAELMRFNIAGRYPETLGEPPSRPEAESRVRAARKVYEWLKARL